MGEVSEKRGAAAVGPSAYNPPYLEPPALCAAPSPAPGGTTPCFALLSPSSAPTPTKAFPRGLQNVAKGTPQAANNRPGDPGLPSAGPEVCQFRPAEKRIDFDPLLKFYLETFFHFRKVFHFLLGTSCSGTAQKFPVTAKP